MATSLACALGCMRPWLHSRWAEYTLASHRISRVQGLGLLTYATWGTIPALLLHRDADGHMRQQAHPRAANRERCVHRITDGMNHPFLLRAI